MRLPSREIIEQLRREFPAGTRVELVRMDDAQTPPVGTHGTVLGVDDTGSLLMRWDNGSGLNVVYGEDVVRKISERGASCRECTSRYDRQETAWSCRSSLCTL